MKKPSVKGMSNMEYLGHFAQDRYIQDGHNTDEQFQPFIDSLRSDNAEIKRAEAVQARRDQMTRSVQAARTPANTKLSGMNARLMARRMARRGSSGSSTF